MAQNEVRVVITGDPSALGRALGTAAGQMEGFQAKAAAIGSKMRSVGMTMTAGVTLPIVAVGAVAVKWAGELEDAEAMNRQVFGAMAGDMDRWAAKSAQNFGLSTGDAIEWANQMGIRLRQIGGLAEDQAAKTSQNLVQLAGDFASAFGGSVDEAAQALGSALTGEFEPLKRYGVVINDAALKHKLFQMTGEEVSGTLTAQQKQLATLALIQDQASIVQGDYARNADGATNAQRTMTASLKDAGTALGEVLLPHVTKLVEWVTKAVEWFTNLDDKWQTVIVIAAAVAAAIGPVVFIIGGLVTAIGAIASPVGLVVLAIGALAAGLVWLYQNNEGFREWVDRIAAAIWDGLQVAFNWVVNTGIPALRTAFDWLVEKGREVWAWLVENLGPAFRDIGDLFAAVADAISEKVAEFQAFWAEHGDAIMQNWSNTWTTIVDVLTVAWNTIRGVVEAAIQIVRGIIQIVTGIISGDWSKVWEGIRNVFGGVWDAIYAIVSGIVGQVWAVLQGLGRWVSDTFGGYWNAAVGKVAEAVAGVIAWVQALPGKVTEALSGAINWLYNAGRDILQGLWNGLKSIWSSISGWISDKVNSIPSMFRGILGIRSPSVVMAGIGENVMAGLQRGLSAGFDTEVRPQLVAITGDIGSPGRWQSVGAGSAGAGGNVTHLHFHGPVARDAEGWLLDLIARSNRSGASAIPGVA
jgi:phage-related protein